MIGGTALVVGHLPLMTLFHVTSLSHGQGRLVAGFARQKPVNLGPTRPNELAALAFAPQEEGFADVAWLTAELAADGVAKQAQDRRDRANAEKMLAIILTGKSDGLRELGGWMLLTVVNYDLAHGRGAELCAALNGATADLDPDATQVTAQLISRLPSAEFQALAPQLLQLLNSKRLAYRVANGDPAGTTAADKRATRTVGHSLVKKVPLLYARLGELGEQARALITGLGQLNNWPEPLRLARESLDIGQLIDLDNAK